MTGDTGKAAQQRQATGPEQPRRLDVPPRARRRVLVSDVVGVLLVLAGYACLMYAAATLRLAMTLEPPMSTRDQILTVMEWSGFTCTLWAMASTVVAFCFYFSVPPDVSAHARPALPDRQGKAFWLGWVALVALCAVMASPLPSPWLETVAVLACPLSFCLLARFLRPGTAPSYVHSRMWAVLVIGIAVYAAVWVHPPLADFEPVRSWVQDTVRTW